MKNRKLGRSDIAVSEICLGTMTFGSQNSQQEAARQIEVAIEAGVNFIDTAEMYPTTPRLAETTGRTEEYIGAWIGANPSRRSAIVLATKATGAGNSAIRSGARADAGTIRSAIETSLKRLRTDYVDLYQLHWPNRGSYHFRQNWKYDATTLDTGDMDAELADILGEVQRLREEGKLREFGVSNETAWGMMRYFAVSEREGLPRPVSIQNEYSLLCRHFDLDLSEVCANEDLSLMAYSPLAAGLLSGKYAGGQVPAGSRLSMQPDLNGRLNPVSTSAVAAYGAVARKHGLALNQMAIAFALGRPFMASVIIGATSDAQLVSNLAAANVTLGEEVLADIAAVRRLYPTPF